LATQLIRLLCGLFMAVPFWIQLADFSSEDFPPTGVAGAVNANTYPHVMENLCASRPNVGQEKIVDTAVGQLRA
jgi:hypothetical protein